MKLIFCPICQDVVKLKRDNTKCDCKSSYGHYLNDVDAVIGGKAIPLGFQNSSFAKALYNRPDIGNGFEFTAFVIPCNCNSIRKL